MNPTDSQRHQAATVHKPDPAAVLAELLRGVETLHSLVELFAARRDPAIADQIALQADGVRRTAHRARMALIASGGPPDAAA